MFHMKMLLDTVAFISLYNVTCNRLCWVHQESDETSSESTLHADSPDRCRVTSAGRE